MLQVAFDQQMRKATVWPWKKKKAARAWNRLNVSESYWGKKEYILVAHHKTGTVMGGQARQGLRKSIETGAIYKALNLALGENLLPLFKAPWATLGLATNDKMVQTPRQHCILHLMRNPFEIIVSGYLYHRSTAEEWTTTRFGTAVANQSQPPKPKYENGRMSLWTYGEENSSDYVTSVREFEEHPPKSKTFGYYGHMYAHGIARVMEESSAPPFNTFMPEPNASETFSQYLQRAGTDGGLIANAIWANLTTLTPMDFLHDYVEPQQCSLNVCLSEFYSDCEATWKKIFTTWQIPTKYHHLLFDGAEVSCPLVSKETKKHSSENWAEDKEIDHPPLHELIERMRELDHLVFNGTFSLLEASQSCSVSDHYMTE
jgi:hypothetical protein